MYSKSLAKVEGLQLTYIICFTQNFSIFGSASGCIQALGGSIINKSALFQQRGLKEGDILVTVNGLNVQDPAFIKELVGPGSVKLDLLRDEQRYTMTLNLN